jgi:hypothetical protein
VKSRPSIFVCGINVCTLNEEAPNNIFGASSSGIVKSRPSVFVYGINICTTVEELPNSLT